MMHGTPSESDVTSIDPPSSSPKAYYVQSPSCDSHDETDKCSSSNSRNPLDSPSYNPSRPSMASTTSTVASRISGHRRRWNKHYCNVVNEESAYDDNEYYYYHGNRTYLKWLSIVVGFGLVFAGICLIIWGASRPYKPQITIRSLRVHNLYFGAGLDHTGVPTQLVSVNCSASLVIHNPATLFGIHVTSRTAHLLYSQIIIATGQLKRYYQPKHSRRISWITLVGHGVPLYGAGMASAPYTDESGDIPFKLDFEIHSNGNLLGNLLNTKHIRHASCSLVINSKYTKVIILRQNSCQYI